MFARSPAPTWLAARFRRTSGGAAGAYMVTPPTGEQVHHGGWVRRARFVCVVQGWGAEA